MITGKEVERIAGLARIKIMGKEKLKGDLSRILDYVAKLNEIDTKSVEPLSQITGLVNSVRQDEFRGEVGDKSLLISQAPEKENNLVKVRAVLEKK